MSDRTFTTKLGTILPILNLQGKDYLTVQYRIVWFREEHPLWCIKTEILDSKDGFIIKAMITDEKGLIIATAHKWSGSSNYPLECAETGAIGRCLSFIGYGTAHCGDELSEGDELADSPLDAERFPHCAFCQAQMLVSKKGDNYYCPNWNDQNKGKHETIPRMKS